MRGAIGGDLIGEGRTAGGGGGQGRGDLRSGVENESQVCRSRAEGVGGGKGDGVGIRGVRRGSRNQASRGVDGKAGG